MTPNARIAALVTTDILANNVLGIVTEPNVLVPVAGGTLLLFISIPNRKGANGYCCNPHLQEMLYVLL